MNFNDIQVEYFVRQKKSIALIISSFQPTKKGSDLLRIALDSIIKFKRDNVCIWVVDVGSPDGEYLVTPDEYPTVNFIITRFIPRSWEKTPSLKRIVKKMLGMKPPRAGSYANGWTLDLGIHAFNKLNYKPAYFMTLQMDVMFTRDYVMDALLNLFDEQTAVVGVRPQLNHDKTENTIHSLGNIWKFESFQKIDNQSFQPEFPKYDVGERLISEIKKLGYKVKSLSNANTSDKINSKLNMEEQSWNCDKCVDENNNIVFMHLGRGTIKVSGDTQSKTYKKYTEGRIDYAVWSNIYKYWQEKHDNK